MPSKNRATNFEMLMPALITLSHQVAAVDITCADPKFVKTQYKIYCIIQDAINDALPQNSWAED